MVGGNTTLYTLEKFYNFEKEPMTTQEIRQNEIEYCLDHIVYFVRTYGHYEDKDAAELIQPFNMWDEQESALISIHTHRLNAILKARQLGFSWLVINYCSYILLLPGRTIIALSRSEEEAKELIRRLAVVLKNMPEFFQEEKDKPAGWSGMTYKANALELIVHYPDGRPDSIMKGFPSSPAAARSFTADLLIFDEWAFQQFAREIWTSAFPVINRPMGGKVIGLSTIDRGSLFEEIFTDPDNGFNKIFVPWYADPRRDKKWYEDTKRALGDLITQEYPATIEEALTVPGGAFFPEVRKDTHITKWDYIKGMVKRYVCIDYGLDMLSVHWIKIDAYNNAQVYREYDSPDKTIGAACDIMIDLTGDEKIEMWLAPPDLWNRSQESGKSRAQLFADGGINLTKTSNDFPAGCSGMKEWLKPQSEGKAKLTIAEDAAPNLFRNLQKIQRDKNRPNVYAKEPHDLTHDCDSLRCFCVYWTSPADKIHSNVSREWTEDMWEDYNNAHSEEDRQRIIKNYGEPR